MLIGSSSPQEERAVHSRTQQYTHVLLWGLTRRVESTGVLQEGTQDCIILHHLQSQDDWHIHRTP